MKKNKTYTVVFMKVIDNTNYPVPSYWRQYKDKKKAYKAMSKYYADTGCESFLVRGDNRNSHDKKDTSEVSLSELADSINTSVSVLTNERVQ